MAPVRQHSLFALASRQHGVVSYAQLLRLGFSADAIRHLVDRGLLHRWFLSVYAVGRPELSERGRCLAAVLACGEDSALSHHSAAVLWRMLRPPLGPVHVSCPGAEHRHPGIRMHRRTPMPETTVVDGIPVTTPAWTIVDVAAHVSLEQLIKATNEADRQGLVSHDELASLVGSLHHRRGLRKLRVITGAYTRTDSNLERRFLRLVSHASLPKPQTQVSVEGLRVDFYWPELNLVVETDGLTYHRTPAEQAADRKRDQVLTAAGITCLRFTNQQVREDARFVRDVLSRVVAERLPRR